MLTLNTNQVALLNQGALQRFQHKQAQALHIRYPQFFGDTHERERLQWVINAMEKGASYDIHLNRFGGESMVIKFLDILARIGINFDEDERCDFYRGALMGNQLPLKVRINLISRYLDYLDAIPLGCRQDAGANCLLRPNKEGKL